MGGSGEGVGVVIACGGSDCMWGEECCEGVGVVIALWGRSVVREWG